MDFAWLGKHFNEAGEPEREIFDKLTLSEELHYIADNHNWDNGITALEWIAESKLCCEATALMIFWRAQPNDFRKYSYKTKTLKNETDAGVFNLIKKIMENYQNGFYAKSTIKYNPKDDMPKDIPDVMFQETGGEEPYIYYEAKDAWSLRGDYLDGALARCGDAMYKEVN